MTSSQQAESWAETETWAVTSTFRMSQTVPLSIIRRCKVTWTMTNSQQVTPNISLVWARTRTETDLSKHRHIQRIGAASPPRLWTVCMLQLSSEFDLMPPCTVFMY